MLGLDQNLFVGTSKRYSLENDFNAILIKFALENIDNEKNECLIPFILRINIIIAQKVIKASKNSCRKNELFETKILERAKGKKIKKFKSCSKYGINGWYKFGMLFFARS